MTPLEVVAFVAGVVAVWLTTRENALCWPVGLVNVALYAVVFGRAQLYASAALQVVYAGLALYGWWAWSRGGEGRTALAVSRAPGGALLGLAAAGALFAAAFGAALARTDAALPFWDAGTAAFSLVAQALQTRKWIENWAVWIVVDGVLVGMYVSQALFWTAGLYAIFLGLAVAGHLQWRRSLRRVAEAA